MPKENIHALDGRVVVAWTPGKDLQVGVERGPEVYINSEPVAGVSTTGYGSGQYATLDRAGVNRMIRALRKARDAAFGADA